MDLNDKEFQRFIDNLKDLKPIFCTQEIVGFDDGFGSTVSFCGCISVENPVKLST